MKTQLDMANTVGEVVRTLSDAVGSATENSDGTDFVRMSRARFETLLSQAASEGARICWDEREKSVAPKRARSQRMREGIQSYRPWLIVALVFAGVWLALSSYEVNSRGVHIEAGVAALAAAALVGAVLLWRQH